MAKAIRAAWEAFWRELAFQRYRAQHTTQFDNLPF